jgi:hypothetical protein
MSGINQLKVNECFINPKMLVVILDDVRIYDGGKRMLERLHKRLQRIRVQLLVVNYVIFSITI